MRHLLTTEHLDRKGLSSLLDDAQEFVRVLARPIPKVPALRGKTVAVLFFEPSTRTKISFERAARALSADLMAFVPDTSALQKGENLKDTVMTVKAMGADLMIVRHRATGVPWQVANWANLPVVNAGDGAHQHPTQALLDCLTIRQRFSTLDGLRIGIVGDIRHSRVARSGIFAMTTMGAEVTLIGPPTLLPLNPENWPVQSSTSFDDVLPELDVVYLLRIQEERGGASFPSLSEYRNRFGMTRDRMEYLKPDAIVMHPGPMVRGSEIDADVADDCRTLVLHQVGNGVAMRMAVLFQLLGGDFDD